MTQCNLADRKCAACNKDTKVLSEREVSEFRALLSQDWTIGVGSFLMGRTFKFKNFKEAMKFVNKVAEIAEEENHHPDIEIYDYRNVQLSLCTHATGGGLSENDFIVAEKINKIVME